MDSTLQTRNRSLDVPPVQQAWDIVTGQLRVEMSKGQFDTWVQPLQPLGYRDHVFSLGAINSYGRDWVESHLKSTITRQLEGLYDEHLSVQIRVVNGFNRKAEDDPRDGIAPRPEDIAGAPLEEDEPRTPPAPRPGRLPGGETAAPSTRKVMLQRAYGTERAAVIQPERGLFVTAYFLDHWQPLLGLSAAAAILAARRMCYWNPMTRELRNTVDTDMSELAARAGVSVRTVKDVLGSELVRRYFLRYTVRRMMTPNGVRTAGICLQVRMDEPLTPEDQTRTSQEETGPWYTPEFEDETGED